MWIAYIMDISKYVFNFDWEISFWKPTTGSQTMHNFCIKGKDGSLMIAQLWLVGELQHILLVMMDKNYWGIRILISTKTRDRLRMGLKSHGILKGA